MRSVLYTLQRLQEQEKKEKQRALAAAQGVLSDAQQAFLNLQTELNEERTRMPKTAGEMALQDRLLVNQFYALCRSEEEMNMHEETVEVCQESLLFARRQTKITERLIEVMEEEIAVERKRKQDKETDDLGIVGWWRNQG